MISFDNAQGSVLLLIYLMTDFKIILRAFSNGYKGYKYFFFIKVGAANVLLKWNYLQPSYH